MYIAHFTRKTKVVRTIPITVTTNRIALVIVSTAIFYFLLKKKKNALGYIMQMQRLNPILSLVEPGSKKLISIFYVCNNNKIWHNYIS